MVIRIPNIGMNLHEHMCVLVRQRISQVIYHTISPSFLPGLESGVTTIGLQRVVDLTRATWLIRSAMRDFKQCTNTHS